MGNSRATKELAGGNLRLLLVCMLFSFHFSLFTQSVSAGDHFDFKGFLSVDKRFLVEQNDLPIIDFYNNLQVELRAKPGDKVNAVASMDFRYYDYPSGTSVMESLQSIDTPTPLEVGLWEAYVSMYGFLLDNLDLRLGKQRIVWGTADKLNQTDNLNPDDFSDPLDFGRKIPSTAFMGTYYLGGWEIIGVWVPAVRPALLPSSGLDPITMFAADMPPEISLTIQSMATEYPDFTIPNSMGALKIKGNLLNIDVSASYFHGYDDIPVPQTISLSGEPPYEFMAADATMGFPGIDVIGFDLAGELLTIGFWAEGAVCIPDGETSVTIVSDDPLIQALIPGFITGGQVEMLKDEPYFKYTVGSDYTFKNGVYLNGQFVHGFFTEAGEENLSNYFIARLEKSIFHSKVKLALAGGLASTRIMDWDAFQDTLAYFAVPDIQYLGIDNLEVDLGYFFLDGKPGTLFGGMTDYDQVYLKFKISF